MRHRLRNQVALTFIGMMLLALIAIGVINIVFLEDYYLSAKMDVLRVSYGSLENYDLYSDDIPDQLVAYSYENSLSWMVSDPINSRNQGFCQEKEAEWLRLRLFGYQTGLLIQDDVEILDKTDHYILQKSGDKSTDMEYVELWGRLQNGNTCLIRTPLESIRESAAISNRFFIYVGLLIAFSSALVIFFLTNRLTKPILELTEISRRMEDLDFEAKYNSRAGNEIDTLGENFNSMSHRLEQTITELKQANFDLEQDIADKIKIDEMRKEFLDNVSHELKTPIALVQGYAEGLKDNINDDPESMEFYCDVIIDEAGKMNRMVRQLLNLNQLESGQDSVNIEHFDIVELIRGVVDKSNILVEQKGARVQVEGAESLKVWADEFKIEEVVTNFFTNALNHLNEEKRIVIRIQPMDKKARILVFNTGAPIPEEDLPNVWNKFYKVDKARTREYGGSGIGLSIVRAIMESHHQKYGVINHQNGVEFWFELNCE